MSITYRFRNLQELAAWIENKGIEVAGRHTATKRDADLDQREGAAYRSIAYMIRNTIIEDNSVAP